MDDIHTLQALVRMDCDAYEPAVQTRHVGSLRLLGCAGGRLDGGAYSEDPDAQRRTAGECMLVSKSSIW